MSYFDTILQEFNVWLAKTGGYSTGSIQTYLRIIRNFLALLGLFKIANLKDVPQEIVLRFISYKGDIKYADSHIRLRLSALQIFYFWAVKMHYCYTNPIIEYRKTRLDKKEPSATTPKKDPNSLIILSQHEQNKLISYDTMNNFTSIRDKCIVLLLLTSGLFSDEIIQLPFNSMHIEGYIDIVTGRQRCVPLDMSICKKSLNNWLQERKRVLGNSQYTLLFFTQQIQPITRRMLYKIISQFLRKVGIEKEHMGSYLLRETAIVNMLRNGKTLEEIQAYTGIQTLFHIEKYRAFSD